MKDLVNLLINKQLTIASVESLTAGLFASSIAAIPHASNVLYGGLVTYQSKCKIDVLKVNKNIIDSYGVISSECAQAMAVEGEKIFNTDIVVSCSGNAGPDVMDDKACGQVYMCIKYHQKIYNYDKIFSGDRNEIRNKVVLFLCEEVKKIV